MEKVSAHTLTMLQESTRRLKTLIRFSRWSQARAQARCVKSLCAQVDPGSEAAAEARQALAELKRRGGFFSQLPLALLDIALAVLLLGASVFAASLGGELGLLVFGVGLPVVLAVSSSARGNPWLHGEKGQRLFEGFHGSMLY